ncbi:biotin transporter BioY [Thermotalea metallivorans]|uniref:Biotin transporter n=1 Tax=Thermotalea metallivorans TaxID=520762 RepID=A0A140LDL6_9FIRM|nr:biotin transporter BioY [Thermotalea metallivorans]KXG78641.1 Biotin transporter BioY [Thermotalea metallivorans]
MKLKTRDMILIALFAALTAIGAFIKIYNPFNPLVPFTLQFLFCAFAGTLLGARLGLYSQLLYVGIGLMGVPVFTKGGGPSYVFQPTFGYLLGFIFCAWIIGKFTENLKEVKFMKVFLPVVAGLMVIYGIGVPYLYLIVNQYLGKSMSFGAALAAGFTPYILPDLCLSALIAFTSVKVIPSLRRAGYVDVKQN